MFPAEFGFIIATGTALAVRSTTQEPAVMQFVVRFPAHAVRRFGLQVPMPLPDTLPQPEPMPSPNPDAPDAIPPEIIDPSRPQQQVPIGDPDQPATVRGALH